MNVLSAKSGSMVEALWNFSDDDVWQTVCSQARMMPEEVRKALEVSDASNRAAGRSTESG